MSKVSKEAAVLANLDARERILKAAAKLFSEQGLHATTTRQLARAADVNISLISYYFNGKEGLYDTLLAEYGKRVETEVKELLRHGQAEDLTREIFIQTLEALIEGMLQSHVSEPQMKLILANEMNAGMPHSADLFDTVFDGIASEVVKLVKRAQAAGYVRRELNPMMFMMTLAHSFDVLMISGRCQSKLSRQLPKFPEARGEILKQMKLMFMEGVLT